MIEALQFNNRSRMIICKIKFATGIFKPYNIYSLIFLQDLRGYHNFITFSNASAPGEERCLLLESLSKCVAEVSELFRSSNVTS